MHPEDITASLRKEGSSQAQIARDLRIQRSSVSQVVAGRHNSRRVQSAISKAIKKPIAKIWPKAKRGTA